MRAVPRFTGSPAHHCPPSGFCFSPVRHIGIRNLMRSAARRQGIGLITILLVTPAHRHFTGHRDIFQRGATDGSNATAPREGPVDLLPLKERLIAMKKPRAPESP